MTTSLNKAFEEYMSEMGMSKDKMPHEAMQMLKNAFYHGACAVTYAYQKAYNRNPKLGVQAMLAMGKEAEYFKQNAPSMQQMMAPEAGEGESMGHSGYGQKHFGWGGGWGRGFGGWGRGWGGGLGWPLIASSYGYGGGYPYWGGGMWWKDQHHMPYGEGSPYYDAMPYHPYDRSMGGEYPHHMHRGHPRYDDQRMYTKDNPYPREGSHPYDSMIHDHMQSMREQYPDVEAEKRSREEAQRQHEQRQQDPRQYNR